jgi:hypothetical protein
LVFGRLAHHNPSFSTKAVESVLASFDVLAEALKLMVLLEQGCLRFNSHFICNFLELVINFQALSFAKRLDDGLPAVASKMLRVK